MTPRPNSDNATIERQSIDSKVPTASRSHIDLTTIDRLLNGVVTIDIRTIRGKEGRPNSRYRQYQAAGIMDTPSRGHLNVRILAGIDRDTGTTARESA